MVQLNLPYFFIVNKLIKKPIIDLPTFLSKPDRVVGIPVWRANRCLTEEIPKALFQEKEKPYFVIKNYFKYFFKNMLLKTVSSYYGRVI